MSGPLLHPGMDPSGFVAATERLIQTIQKLSLARSLESIISIVRTEARALTGADGATFILRDEGCCYYADEDAISPLWKGKRFPMNHCISGWVMLNHQPAVIEDIYKDPRIPHDAYRPTFVKSLVMVPIRTKSPIGAIGNYWAIQRKPSAEEVKLLQALADSTSTAIENVRLYSDLEQRVVEKTLAEKQYRHLSEQLTDSLNEKEALLKEVYHRVKNNLQVISSLLNLQAETTKNSSMKSVLVESSARVKSMALVHEMLYQSDNLSKIPMKEYINNLFNYLYMIYGIDSNKINCTIDVDELYLDIDMAIPYGLIINEIISNIFKHAFPKNKLGEIQFSLNKNSKEIVLIVRDNGVGIPESIYPENATSLGLRLIYNLTRQLNGKITLNRDCGTEFKLVVVSR
ncbi:MAG: histidine kinase dimerization/phosphoacceptor domain -containing protein [Gammaproteobacteria bacterium]|nr:histidine kinase dimerization/phosphoacceptor domain -containing protein [Gammaproteobacteria bacterium]